MNITINGKIKEFETPQNLNAIVGHFCKDKTHVIAEINGDIIKKETWQETLVSEGDEINLITFMGGGEIKSKKNREINIQ